MSLFEVVLIAVSLAMDCFSVSMTVGVCCKNTPWRLVTLMALMFGGFQMIMPYVGYYMGSSFLDYIQDFDHWIAFGILSLIGLSMIFSKEDDDNENKRSKDFFSMKSLLLLSVATSIDALATGVVFLAESQVFFSFAVIGIVASAFSLAGYWLGRFVGRKIPFKFEIVGGVILILVGARILFEHLTA